MVCTTIHNIGSYHAEAPGDQDMFDYLKRRTDSGTVSARVRDHYALKAPYYSKKYW